MCVLLIYKIHKMGEKSLLIASGNFENVQNLDIIPDNIRRRKSISVKEKLEILKLVDNGCKLSAVARQYGISLSTASTINKERYKIKMLSDQCNIDPHRKRMRMATFRDVDEAVHMWFLQQRTKNIPINGPILQQKAKEFALLLGHKNFEGSKGWLFRFREKYRISAKAMREKDDSNACCSGVGMTDEEIVNSVSQSTVPLTFSDQSADKKSILGNFSVPDTQLDKAASEVSHNQFSSEIHSDELPAEVNHSQSNETQHGEPISEGKESTHKIYNSRSTFDNNNSELTSNGDHSMAESYNCVPIVKYNDSDCASNVDHNQTNLSDTYSCVLKNELDSEYTSNVDYNNSEHTVVYDKVSVEYKCRSLKFSDRTVNVPESGSSLNLPDAITYAEQLTWFLTENDVPSHILESINAVSKFLEIDLRNQMKQKKITDYFKI